MERRLQAHIAGLADEIKDPRANYAVVNERYTATLGTLRLPTQHAKEAAIKASEAALHSADAAGSAATAAKAASQHSAVPAAVKMSRLASASARAARQPKP